MPSNDKDDEKFGEICRWLRQNRKVMFTNLSGKSVIMTAKEFYGHDQSPFHPVDPPRDD